jgi:hypothetical protein
MSPVQSVTHVAGRCPFRSRDRQGASRRPPYKPHLVRRPVVQCSKENAEYLKPLNRRPLRIAGLKTRCPRRPPAQNRHQTDRSVSRSTSSHRLSTERPTARLSRRYFGQTARRSDRGRLGHGAADGSRAPRFPRDLQDLQTKPAQCCSPARSRSPPVTRNSAIQPSPIRFSTAWCTTLTASNSRANRCAGSAATNPGTTVASKSSTVLNGQWASTPRPASPPRSKAGTDRASNPLRRGPFVRMEACV